MRQMAMELGVPDESIFLDYEGLNTRETVANTARMFEQMDVKRVMAVSHYFHLARIKMAYQRRGLQVYTVPAKEQYVLTQTPYLLCREVAAMVVYYLFL